VKSDEWKGPCKKKEEGGNESDEWKAMSNEHEMTFYVLSVMC
jgi:hypothetical protein